ncbi:SusC/RagA family TonB-linked outer membrane protein [Flavivirga algicola]|uniref:SusC/RagA family TonB-linked outer membrane protein n=1 Tax=Flavivirga algicola TaxID=2729136 RepID=A0ABX1RVS3_9FLAO|nr:SusC/RagA family TonB-linked outer membrane protein [Flavivirga algicola]NMH87143.1 SusC/RagA family TonB-linked outer membrane protein [Flavivirga algicola]
MSKKLLFFLIWVFLLSSSTIIAQNKTVTGTVTDQYGASLPGTNVILKDTPVGTSSDFDGKYSIDLQSDGILVFSMVGFKTQEISTSGKKTINVTLIEDISELKEVVVTALGIKREAKSVGYATQTISGSDLVAAREPNVTNSLTGKVAGVQILRSSNGPAGSSKIVLRGNNSLTGDNQPLIVVDGVPMDNFTGAANNDFFNPSPDLGNGLGDLNAEDIENISVLKGAAAAALYGTRAGNGAILITTKTGKGQKGLGITYSATTSFETIFMSPDLQSSFGQGSDGLYDNQSGSSWGPKIEGQIVERPNGLSDAPLLAHDNLDSFFRTGTSQEHSLSFQQQVNEKTSIYSSIKHSDIESMIPEVSLEKLNVTTRSISKFGKDENWQTDVKFQYLNIIANNRPVGGDRTNNSNLFATMYLLPRSLNINDYRINEDEFGNMIWYREDGLGGAVNPFFAVNNQSSFDKRNRFLFNGAIKNQINNWLSAEVKAGVDLYSTNNESRIYSGGPQKPTGAFSLGKINFVERNFSALITASKKDVFGKLGGTVNLGGNLMHRENSFINSQAEDLVVPDLFSINNAVNRPNINEGIGRKKINSLFGTFQISYDDVVFLDFTGRNDWSSALSKDNRSFFYPSVSSSVVLSELFGLNDENSKVSYLKLRGSYAEVGNDLDEFRLVNTFRVGLDPNGDLTSTTGETLLNPDIKSELIKSWEVGFDARVLNNRVGINLTYYKSNATNQLINIPLDPLSGFKNQIINAGDIENKGLEILANVRAVEAKDFTWDFTLNYSKNENTVKTLSGDVTQFRLGGFDNVEILAVAGAPYGEIYGTAFARVEDEQSPDFGKIIVDAEGIPTALNDGESVRLGNQQPDALLGFSNTFTYKNFSFSFLIDARIGGEIFSASNVALQVAGTAANTVVNGERPDITFDGVVADGSGGFTQNTVAVNPEVFYQTINGRTGNLGISENNIYDATNVRLRSAQLNYSFSDRLLNKTPFNKAKIGVSANNIWMISSKLNGIDPESVYATGTNAVGFENLSSPTSRTVFFNILLGF